MDWSELMLTDKSWLGANSFLDRSITQEEYTKTLADSLFDRVTEGKVYSFSNSHTPKNLFSHRELVDYSTPSRPKTRKRRKICQLPEKILDAPDFVDDYYLNLLDWSSDNFLAVALGKTVYLWNAGTGDIEALVTLDDDDYVCSVSWAAEGRFLAVGSFKGDIMVYDAHQLKLLRTLKGHQSRVSCLAWNGQILSSGGRDSCIINYDVGRARPIVSIYEEHHQEVCGLKWNPEGTQLASGGNDNLLMVWDKYNSEKPRYVFDQHKAAVKAVEWCPHQANLLVSGGGTADRHIRFWNTATGSLISEHDTKSQVCSILWSKNHKNELVSSHGFSQNQLTVWDYPRMTKLTELTGHTERVLQMAMSPDGETVVSIAADETLRFWRIFENKPSVPKKKLDTPNRCIR